ncbi:MAG: hypothetical protein QOG65_1559 [Actinomycetota bacterium]|nr:hypothetical protein [Actinomycetota bacterium]
MRPLRMCGPSAVPSGPVSQCDRAACQCRIAPRTRSRHAPRTQSSRTQSIRTPCDRVAQRRTRQPPRRRAAAAAIIPDSLRSEIRPARLSRYRSKCRARGLPIDNDRGVLPHADEDLERRRDDIAHLDDRVRRKEIDRVKVAHDENAIFVRPRPERCRNRRVRDDVDPTEHRARRARKYRFGKLEPFWIVEQGAPIEWSSWEACVRASVLNQHGPPTIVTY